ncbi:MAG: SDR family oxidoreductase [Acidobacteria bacterium]|nr:SDR family oxidoreductase [Acidobacteriota bacterium]
MRLLVTGASGLIGGRLIRFLLERGGVTIRAASRIARAWPAGVEGCVADIGRPASLADACRGVDAVINLSSMSERACCLDPAEALRVNAGGTLALASAAAGAGVTRFVQLSTYKVYGDNPSGCVTEETPPKPRSHYAITHRTAEDYAQSQHPNCVVFRLANGFGAPAGPSADGWQIIANELCKETVVRRQITIRSSGLAWRNFVPMPDIVGALHASITSLAPGTYNLGASSSMTLRDLAARVARVSANALGIRPALTFGPVDPGGAPAPLDYRTDKLLDAGYGLIASFDDELLATLLAASATFRPDRND